MRRCAEMPYHSGIVLRFYPSRWQKQVISVNDGCKRSVYNHLVGWNDERYQLSKASSCIPAFASRLDYLNSILHHGSKALPACIKNALPYLCQKEVDSLAIDNAIKNYRAAWKKYRDDPKAGTPKFHKKSYEQSYQTNAHYHAGATDINGGNVRFEDMSHLTLPILGRVRIKGSKKRITGLMKREQTRIGTITIRKDSVGRYFVSLQLASEYPFVSPVSRTGKACGIDLNIDNFLWDSDNHRVDNPKFRRSEQDKIAKLQKSMARKANQAKKGHRPLWSCKNYQKDRKALAALHSRIKNRGEDFRHVVSKRYIENQDIIVAEDLKVSNLLKNHRLALSISECGWGDFLRKLSYKADMYDKVFVKVPPHFTSQTCSHCGYVLSKEERLELSDREWVCPSCGFYHVRDYNASKNILAKGLAALGLNVY